MRIRRVRDELQKRFPGFQPEFAVGLHAPIITSVPYRRSANNALSPIITSVPYRRARTMRYCQLLHPCRTAEREQCVIARLSAKNESATPRIGRPAQHAVAELNHRG